MHSQVSDIWTDEMPGWQQMQDSYGSCGAGTCSFQARNKAEKPWTSDLGSVHEPPPAAGALLARGIRGKRARKRAAKRMEEKPPQALVCIIGYLTCAECAVLSECGTILSVAVAWKLV